MASKTLLLLALAVLSCVGLSDQLAASAAQPYTRTVSYAGQKVFSCSLNGTAAEMARLTTDPDLDVWAVREGRRMDIRTLSASAEADLRRLGCRVHIDDVNEWMEKQESGLRKGRSSRSPSLLNGSLEWFDDYHPYEDIIAFYTALADEYSSLVTLTPSIGQSLELRPMPVVKITASAAPETPIVLLTCQIHAREWISSATCMYMAQTLAEKFETDPQVRDLLAKIEVHFVPFLNPDGYAYSWTGDRLWRKNRRVTSNPNCRGVDLNRNFNIRWAEPGGGSSGNPCSETYHGTAAESEPEIEHLVTYFRGHSPIIAGIDYHSYSQLILRPWGFTLDPPPHEEQLREVGESMEAVIRSIHGQTYVSQPGMELYPTVGTSSDWYFSDDASRGNLGYRCAGYTIELRDTGRYGFLLPPTQIIPTGEENFAGLVNFMEQFESRPLPFP